MIRIDETNLRILQMLQKNARISVAEMARAVGRAETTTRERVSAMEMEGIIQRYEARVDWERAGLPATAVIRAGCAMEHLSDLSRQLADIPYVTRALLLTGPKPVFLMLRVRDNDHLRQLMRDRLARTHLVEIEAEVSIETLVEQRQPFLVAAPVAAEIAFHRNGGFEGQTVVFAEA